MDDFQVASALTERPHIFLTNPHHAHIVAAHVDAEGVGLFGGDVDLGVAGLETCQVFET